MPECHGYIFCGIAALLARESMIWTQPPPRLGPVPQAHPQSTRYGVDSRNNADRKTAFLLFEGRPGTGPLSLFCGGWMVSSLASLLSGLVVVLPLFYL